MGKNHEWRRWLAGVWLALAGSFLLPSAVRSDEAELRSRLGIPAEARSVLIFAQSSHVDPDWLLSADQYQKFTDRAFDLAWAELHQDPRYVYSVECVFFFKRWWDKHPERQETLREWVNQGRVRFTGTGVTTPDTLLPEGESILRDYLLGQNWLWQQGMNISPRIAYLPDNFGNSPSLPAILRELGIQYAAFGRIDGKYSPTSDYWPARLYPTPESNAELFYNKLKTLDFIWQAPDGSEVLAHVTEGGANYDMGEMIGHRGGASMMGIYLAAPSRRESRTNERIDSYIRRLEPLSRTGYMFCSVGGDFNPPVPDLNLILDAYNRSRYPETGVWVTLAGLEDYMDLVSYHRDKLPRVALDPNPYWTGFYSSRSLLKQLCLRLSRSLILAETLAVMTDDGLDYFPDLERPWWAAAMSNHHDFITGTSRTRVVNREQLPLLRQAQTEVDAVIAERAAKLDPPVSAAPPPMKWVLEAGVLQAENEYYEIVIEGDRGGCITRWRDRAAGREILAGPSNDIALYSENGGLYKMGMEIRGGRFRELAMASRFPARVSASEQSGVLTVTVEQKFAGHSFVRELFLRSDSPLIRFRLSGKIRPGRTATVVFRPALAPGRFIQEVPYGVVERPLEKFFAPTFWAVKNWVDLMDHSGLFGVNLAVTAPGAVSARADGRLEAVAIRHCPMDRPMDLPAVHALVAHGFDFGEREFEYAFWPHGAQGWIERRVFATAQTALSKSFIEPGHPNLEALASSIITLDRPDVVVTAVKPAENGPGVVIRLFRYAPEPVAVTITCHGKTVRSASLLDALERELAPLALSGNKVQLEMPYALATILLQ